MAIPFHNPIEDCPPIETTARIELAPTAKGGLKEPLAIPSQSLVFRDLEAEGDLPTGYVAVIKSLDVEQLEPGSSVICDVTFIGVPAEKVWAGREFALWAGHDLGSATVIELLPEQPPDPPG